jgi:hypothetical protein
VLPAPSGNFTPKRIADRLIGVQSRRRHIHDIVTRRGRGPYSITPGDFHGRHPYCPADLVGSLSTASLAIATDYHKQRRQKQTFSNVFGEKN